MAFKFHTEGRQWAFEVLFSEEQVVPASFYVGLCTDADLAENASLTDINELGILSGADLGYVRQALESSALKWTSESTGSNDRKITSATITFTAEDASGVVWSNAKTWFLATTSNNAGKLLCSGLVNSGTGFALTQGQPYSFQIELTWPQS
jgi:hypothetical protein